MKKETGCDKIFDFKENCYDDVGYGICGVYNVHEKRTELCLDCINKIGRKKAEKLGIKLIDTPLKRLIKKNKEEAKILKEQLNKFEKLK